MEQDSHDPLYGGCPLVLGKAFWFILKAHHELYARSHTGVVKSSGLPEVSTFGKDIGRDEIHWWIFKREDSIDELEERTRAVLDNAQLLKEHARELSGDSPITYADIISMLSLFAESHVESIGAIYDYVHWLSQKDVIAPCILFAHRVWGDTRRADRVLVYCNANR